MEEAPKHELSVIYLKNTTQRYLNDTHDMDRAAVRRWLCLNTNTMNWNLTILPLMLKEGHAYKEPMDNLIEQIRGAKYYMFIVEVGCHASKYFYDRLLGLVESSAHVTLLSVFDNITLQQAVFKPIPPTTINLDAIRRCITLHQMQEVTKDLAHRVRLPNGIIELDYVEQLNVEVERRPETLDEKFNTIMQGGLSNLTPYWDIQIVEIDPVPVKPRPDADCAMEETCEE